VVHSEASLSRAKENILKKVSKEKTKIKKELFHIQAEKFECKEDARRHLEKKSEKWDYHQLDQVSVSEHKKYNGKGRPQAGMLPEKVVYEIKASFKEDTVVIEQELLIGSCYVLGTNINKEALSSHDIIENYSEQQCVERGFRFLKDPLFFTSSLFIKKQSRIEAMLAVMTLALLVCAIAERRLRKTLRTLDKKLPNQINKQVQNPTLRWIFQILDGVCRVKIRNNDIVSYVWTGLTEVRINILSLFGITTKDIYQIS